MLMIPLPFVLALFVAAFLVYEWSQRGTAQRAGWLLAFLGLLVFQEVLVGLRFGYGVDWLRMIQPITAALLPPLAYLSFLRPAHGWPVAIHLLPLLGVLIAIFSAPLLMDTVLAFGNIFYASALIRLGLRGTDGLGWVETHRSRAVLLLMWFVCAVLLLSGLADGIIAYDFWATEGDNTGRIAGWISALGMVCAMAAGLFYRAFSKSRTASVPVNQEDRELFDALTAMMASERLHLDPDINLNRVARRMVRPARDVSKAINRQTGGNFSQYINSLRIEEACALLKGEMPITQIVFAAGFNTKSNFNREFLRIKGQAPSEWRAANR